MYILKFVCGGLAHSSGVALPSCAATWKVTHFEGLDDQFARLVFSAWKKKMLRKLQRNNACAYIDKIAVWGETEQELDEHLKRYFWCNAAVQSKITSHDIYVFIAGNIFARRRVVKGSSWLGYRDFWGQISRKRLWNYKYNRNLGNDTL